jgi:DNA-binding MarR family transcriptional regulator
VANPKTLLEDLIVAASRLTRMAAQSTGSTTPASVWRTLSILTTDGPMRVGDLARASRVSQPSMTKVQQHLVEQELVYRIADVDDSRAWLIAITPKGMRALDGWKAQLAQAMSPMFSDLTTDEIQVLERAVGILQERTNTKRKVA